MLLTRGKVDAHFNVPSSPIHVNQSLRQCYTSVTLTITNDAP
jgi:hypothetical protein